MSTESKAQAAWETRIGGKIPEGFLKACAEKTAGLDEWQAGLEIDSLVDAFARRKVLAKVGKLGTYLENAVNTISGRIEAIGGDPVAQARALGSLREKIDGVASSLDRLETRLDALGKKAAAAQDAKLAAMEETIREKDEIINSLREQIALAQEEMAATKRERGIRECAAWLGFAIIGLLLGSIVTGIFTVAMARKIGGTFF